MDRFEKRLRYRKVKASFLKGLCVFSTLTALLFLVVLLGDIISDGLHFLNWSFITNFPSRIPANAGIQSALMGSIWLIVLTCMIAIPVGIRGQYLSGGICSEKPSFKIDRHQYF
jgi:phosphate transport system permease protein